MKNSVITIVVSVLLSLAAALLSHANKPAPLPPAQGVVSSETLSSPTCIAGKCVYDVPQSFIAATTTPCGIKSPSATSSLLRLLVQTTQSTTSALTLRIASSTSLNATTTSLVSQGLTGMGSVAYIPAAAATVYSPNTYLNIGIEGTGYAPTLVGSCQAQFLVF